MRSAKITLDCRSIAEPTMSTIDQMARLQLAARRCGCTLELKDVNPRLLELIGFVGLGALLRVDARGQAEQWKEPRRVEEEGELGDLSVS